MAFIHYKIAKRKINYNFFTYTFFRYHRNFFGSLIYRGRKLWAFNFLKKLKYQLKLKENLEPSIIFFYALLKISPNVLLFPYKIGGKVQGVPLPISWYKKIIYAVKWVIKLLKDKYQRVKINDLVEILVLATYDKGLAIKKKKLFNSISTSNRFLIRQFK